MLRKASEKDFLDLIAFRCAACGCTRTDAANWLRNEIGFENILILEKKTAENTDGIENIVAMLAAVPVRTGYHHGIWFTGLATAPKQRRRGIMSKLLSTCLRAYAEKGYDFAVAAPDGDKTSAWLETLSFKNAFPLRRVNKPIERNLMTQADFDVMTVRRLIEARQNYQPEGIELPEKTVTEMFTRLYGNGITLVSTNRGYGLYYHNRDTLQFIELQADNDHAADVLLQAAREKTGAEQASILLAENQILYPGEGKREGYGMICFMKQPFPVSDVYFRLLI